MYLFLVIATFSDLLLYGLLKQLNVCEKNKKISKIKLAFQFKIERKLVSGGSWFATQVGNSVYWVFSGLYLGILNPVFAILHCF